MLPDRYLFPAVLLYEKEGISVVFPDLDGCVAYGKDEADALRHAREGLGLHLYGMERDRESIPSPTPLKNVLLDPDEAAVLVDVEMPPIRSRQSKKVVKKTLTIPEWLNLEGERAGVNFSQLLQSALQDHLGLR